MTNEKKMTKKDYYAILLTMPSVAENAELVKFIEHEIEMLTKKNSRDRKPTKEQELNEVLKTKLVEIAGAPHTVSEYAKMLETYFPEQRFSPQKISALMRQLSEEGKIKKTIEKRVSYFERV